MKSDEVTSSKAELKSPEQSVRLDWESLRRFLGEQGMKLALDPPPRQFSGGLANLNYLISLDGRETVLRRPPLGKLPPGAYDMGREHRILSRLWRKFPLAPRGLHLCENAGVIGAPFQIIEYRPGFAIRAEMPGSGHFRHSAKWQIISCQIATGGRDGNRAAKIGKTSWQASGR